LRKIDFERGKEGEWMKPQITQITQIASRFLIYYQRSENRGQRSEVRRIV